MNEQKRIKEEQETTTKTKKKSDSNIRIMTKEDNGYNSKRDDCMKIKKDIIYFQ